MFTYANTLVAGTFKTSHSKNNYKILNNKYLIMFEEWEKNLTPFLEVNITKIKGEKEFQTLYQQITSLKKRVALLLSNSQSIIYEHNSGLFIFIFR